MPPPPSRIAQGDRRQDHGRCGGRGFARRPEGAVRRLPRARHPGQQQCRPAVPRFPRARPAEDDRRRHRQHDRGHRAHPEGHRPDGGEKIRPHRQHHLGLGENADGRPRSVVRRARRPHRVPGRRRPLGRRVQRHHQFHAAGDFRHRPLPLQCRGDVEETQHQLRCGAGAERIEAVPAKRIGTPDEFGATCAFLCSAQAGYITGQNFLIDGGRFPGAF